MTNVRNAKGRPEGRPFAFVWRREGERIESALTPSSYRKTQTGHESSVVSFKSNVKVVLDVSRAECSVRLSLHQLRPSSASLANPDSTFWLSKRLVT